MRISTFFLLVFGLVAVLPTPFGLEYWIPLASIPLFIYLRKHGHMHKFTILDLILIPIYAVLLIFVMVYFQFWALERVPWWKILALGIAADIIASALGMIPGVGDGLSAVINFILAVMIIGGFYGAILGLTMAAIAMLPGPSFAANTIMLSILKLISEAVI